MTELSASAGSGAVKSARVVDFESVDECNGCKRRRKRARRTLSRTVEPVPGPAEPRNYDVEEDDADGDWGVVERLRVDWESIRMCEDE